MKKALGFIAFLLIYAVIQYVGLIITMDELICGCSGGNELWLYSIPALLMMILLMSIDGANVRIASVIISMILSMYSLFVLYYQRNAIVFSFSTGQVVRLLYVISVILMPAIILSKSYANIRKR